MTIAMDIALPCKLRLTMKVFFSKNNKTSRERERERVHER